MFFQCFTSDSAFHDIGLEHGDHASPEELEHLSAIVVTNLLHGECIGESHIIDPDFFVAEIFETYGTDGIITDHGELIMIDIGLPAISSCDISVCAYVKPRTLHLREAFVRG